MEDQDIIRLYHQRNEQAVDVTAQKYGRYLMHIAVNILTRPQDAEECVDDTYLAAWQTMPPENPRCLSAFLGRITRNGALSRFRANRAQKRYDGMEVMLSELGECLPDRHEVEQEVEQRELTFLLDVWLHSLPHEDAMLFLRRYWYGDKVQDLAEKMDCPPNRVAQRLRRLREKLRAFLTQRGVSV